MFLSQQEVLKRLKISHPVYNRLRRAGTLPDYFPGTHLYFWPQVLAALEKATGMNLTEEGLVAGVKGVRDERASVGASRAETG